MARLAVTFSLLLLIFSWFYFPLVPGNAAQGPGSVPIYKDPSQPVDVRLEDLLSRMSLDEKLGQMTQIERTVANISIIRNHYIGSVLSGGGSVPSPHATPLLWADMVDSMQTAALNTRLGIPLIYGIDAVHGHNNVHGATIFPHNVGLGATRDPELVRRIGEATAVEVRATGIPYAFAPCVAVCRDPRWGRCYESYGEDPHLVSNMTKVILGLQGTPPQSYPPNEPYVAGSSNVVACAKHYVGDGGTTHGIDENNTVASYSELHNIHMLPYYKAVADGVASIMISYSSWNGVKMSGNKFLISDMLKQRMGFKGFTISDWEALDRITDPPGSDYNYSINVAINAGLDMVMVPYNFEDFIYYTRNQVISGQINGRRIDDAVRRILRVKFIAGLFEKPMADRNLSDKVGSPEHRDIAREAVRKSLVLLKNGKDASKPMLPLNKNVRRILVAGRHGNDIGLQCGGWTIEWQGESGNVTAGTTILEGIKGKVGAEAEVVYEAAVPEAGVVAKGGYDYAIVVVGEEPYAEFHGDDDNLTVPEDGRRMIERVCREVECVVVLVSGRPLAVGRHLGEVGALVAAWLPGTEGGGVAEVLFGEYDFQGKSPRTWFKSVDQLPMNVGDPHYDPLFPHGFGLITGIGRIG
ncbi:hypothetical protein GOP47_0018736 [Adiantum capillus-veneris]|uniref:beta-glucosidase n=1 Tax=Adiantum capillus-veneris TaxID=13818 RepID=A0A9D4Z9X0_ADICA|nr:hypothetical protein GOP47_0018736 [Adiantum capillus-veneris]